MAESKQHWINKTWIGLLIGIIVPMIFFYIYYLSKFSDILFTDYIASMHHYRLLFKAMSLCVLADLPVFYIFVQTKQWKVSRGVVTACFIFAFLVLGYRIFS